MNQIVKNFDRLWGGYTEDTTIAVEWEDDLTNLENEIRADERAKILAKVANLKNEYTDACNMCTRTDCDVCAISNFIDELENIMTI